METKNKSELTTNQANVSESVIDFGTNATAEKEHALETLKKCLETVTEEQENAG